MEKLKSLYIYEGIQFYSTEEKEGLQPFAPFHGNFDLSRTPEERYPTILNNNKAIVIDREIKMTVAPEQIIAVKHLSCRASLSVLS